jgi:hypothetical protein
MTHKRRGPAALATLVVCLCVAACGSSSSSSSASSTSGASSAAASTGTTARRAKLATCLKQHGVTLSSRPAGRPSGGGYGPPGGGGGFFGAGGGRAGGRFSNPKFRAAFQACGAAAGFRGRPGGFRGRPGGFRPSSAAITAYASCVKQHGYTLPKPNLSGKGPIYPVAIEHNAKFQAASKSCASLLRPAGARPGSGGGPPPAS